MPRGRKSPDALQLVPQVPWSPPEPPSEFDAIEAGHWREIVNSMPATWLTGAAKPLLARLCVTITTCELLERDLRLMWAAAGPIDAKLLSSHAMACGTLAKLSQSLRLSPRSRWTAKSAGEQIRETKTARPWELRATGPWDD
jgi:hypothetical protein